MRPFSTLFVVFFQIPMLFAKIKDCLTYASAKNEIKKFAKTIPI